MAGKQSKTTEWKSEVLERWPQKGTSTVWVAQKLEAPDGKKFLGVRKLTVKANGEEIHTSSGISVPLSADSAATLRKLSCMFKRLSNELGDD